MVKGFDEDDKDSYGHRRIVSRSRINKTKMLAKSRQRQCGHSSVNRYVLNYATLMELENDYNTSMLKQAF